MSHDALFQLGMGPVELDATQMEESFTTRICAVAAKVFRDVHRNPCSGRAAPELIALSCAAGRYRGNSARALMSRAVPAPTPPRP